MLGTRKMADACSFQASFFQETCGWKILSILERQERKEDLDYIDCN